MPEEFENEGFTLKRHQIFSIHTTPDEFKNASTTTTKFSIDPVFKLFSVHTKMKRPAFSDSSGLKSVFEKLHFPDGLVWTVHLPVDIKLRFQKFPRCCLDEAVIPMKVKGIQSLALTVFTRISAAALI